LFRLYGWDWRHHHLTVQPTADLRYDIAAHDPRTGVTRRHTADLQPLGSREVLVGCDRTVGEVARFEVRLHHR
jgi:hypothetical protein